MNLDDDLRRALRRAEPPAGFERRVLDRVEATTRGRGTRARTWWPAALAASLLIAAAAAGYYQQRGMPGEHDGERAAREARIALQIASEKLLLVQQRLDTSSERY